MILTWQHLIGIIIIVQLNYAVGRIASHKVANLKDWKLVESLAEEYPYIVALLNRTKEYMCTGIIVNKSTVLTAGSCIDPALYYIAVGSAVISKSINNGSLFEIATMQLHTDYIFELKPTDPNVTRMHSNVGLVFSVLPKLEVYLPTADLGNYFASELHEKNMVVVGYGKYSATKLYVLQHQAYHQAPCANPKWYYCVCGFEYSAYTKTYDHEFGEGAPVFLGREVIGIAATPCGTMELSDGIKYNIFTVVGPYLPWVEKTHPNITTPTKFRARNRGHRDTCVYFIYVLFIISKVFY